MQMYFRIKHFDRYVGIFVILAIILGIGALVFVSRGQKWFAKRSQHTVVFAKVQGLKTGTAVTISGMEVGTVKALRLNREGKVELTLEVLDAYKNSIREDSRATIASTLLGGKSVEITVGSSDQPPLPNGTPIVSQEPKEIADILKEIDIKEPLKKVNETLDNIRSITARLNDPEGELFTLLRNVQFVTTQWKEGKGNVGAILQDKRMHGQITAVLESLREAAANLEATTQNAVTISKDLPRIMGEVDRAVQEVPRIMGDVKKATANLPEIMGDVQKAAGDAPQITENVKSITDNAKAITGNLKTASPQVPELLETTQENLEETERLILGIQNHWLLRGSMPAKGQPGVSLEVSQRESPYERPPSKEAGKQKEKTLDERRQ
jgi:phospholipid/cholesterol/gamma-HCH transport system substrate-binding protein